MSETSLKRAIGERLEGAGFIRKPGTNEFTAPPGFAGAESTMTVDTDPEPASRKKEKPVAEGNVAADELRLLIERIERLEEEKKAISDDVKDVYGEAKSRGYDTKTVRRIVALRKMETHVRQESSALLETYCQALGIQGVLF